MTIVYLYGDYTIVIVLVKGQELPRKHIIVLSTTNNKKEYRIKGNKELNNV